ncbi:hypothetical protein D3C87_1480450 [compost metagenome]
MNGGNDHKVNYLRVVNRRCSRPGGTNLSIVGDSYSVVCNPQRVNLQRPNLRSSDLRVTNLCISNGPVLDLRVSDVPVDDMGISNLCRTNLRVSNLCIRNHGIGDSCCANQSVVNDYLTVLDHEWCSCCTICSVHNCKAIR